MKLKMMDLNMTNEKLIKKNIIQLESYRDLLVREMLSIDDLIKKTFFQTYYNKDDFFANIDILNDTKDKIKLIEYEIDMALMSHEVLIDDENMSLKQACDQCSILSEQILLYLELKKQIDDHDMHKYNPILNYDDLTKAIIDSEKRLYTLKEKIVKEKILAKVSIDMNSLLA